MAEKTEALLNRLNKVRDRDELKKHIDSCSLKRNKEDLSEYIIEVCHSKNFKKSDIIKNADIHRTYGYQILNGEKIPSRDKLLQICIGNGFNIEETNRALKIGNMSILYVKDPRDSTIIYSLREKISLLETNMILDDCELQVLGE